MHDETFFKRQRVSLVWLNLKRNQEREFYFDSVMPRRQYVLFVQNKYGELELTERNGWDKISIKESLSTTELPTSVQCIIMLFVGKNRVETSTWNQF